MTIAAMDHLKILAVLVILNIQNISSARFELSNAGKKFLFHLRRNKRAILSELCPKLGCQHGRCKEVDNKITCDCERNWTGSLCQIPCPQDCGPLGRCVLGEGAVPKCACPIFNKDCNLKTNKPPPKILGIKALATTDTKVINIAEVRESKVQYIPSDCSDVGFYCYNGGTCFKHLSFNKKKLVGVHCKCPDGYYGDLCQNRCTLRCQNHGSCHKDRASGKEMCLCLWEFKGKFCEHRNDFVSVINAL